MGMNMKNIVGIIFLVIMSTVFLIGCSSIESAEETVKTLLNTVQILEIDKANKYILEKGIPNVEEQLNIDNKSGGSFDEDGYRKFSELLYGELKYDILSSKQNKDGSITVTTEIETYNMSGVLDKFIERYTLVDYENYSKNVSERISQDDLKSIGNHIIKDILSTENIEKEKNKIDIVVRKENIRWKVEMSEPLFRIMSIGSLSY